MSVWITWTEQSAEFTHWDYVGNGITEARYKPKTLKKECLFSDDTSPQMIARAKRYVETDMQDRPTAKVIVKQYNSKRNNK